MRKLTLIILMMLLVSTVDYGLSTSFAEIPRLINYQGKLAKKVDGTPETQTKDIIFRIYDSQSAPVAQAIWTETQSVTPDKGTFSVQLGSTKPNGIEGIAFDRQYWLGIQVGADPELSPRQRLTSSAYAFRAENATVATGVETRTSDPASPVAGQIWLRTDL